MVKKPVLLETVSAEISCQAHAGQRPGASVVGCAFDRRPAKQVHRTNVARCNVLRPRAQESEPRPSRLFLAGAGPGRAVPRRCDVAIITGALALGYRVRSANDALARDPVLSVSDPVPFL